MERITVEQRNAIRIGNALAEFLALADLFGSASLEIAIVELESLLAEAEPVEVPVIKEAIKLCKFYLL